MCINAEESYEKILSLPLSPRNSKKDIEIVVDEIRNLAR